MSSIRILVVDDFVPFRQIVQSILEETRDLEVVCEAADGAEAVQRAKELRPEVILLDINLSGVSGIEAAREILAMVPESKLVFLSLDRSPALVREALSTGAHGYVVKWSVARELVTAVRTVMMDQPFISEELAGYNLDQSPDEQPW